MSKSSIALALTTTLGCGAIAYSWLYPGKLHPTFSLLLSKERTAGAPDTIDRSKEKDWLKTVLTSRLDEYFLLFTGPPCSGKTSLMHEAVTELAKKHNVPGIICVTATREEPIAETIGRALGLSKSKCLTLKQVLENVSPESGPTLDPLHIFSECLPVTNIVIDNANALLPETEKEEDRFRDLMRAVQRHATSVRLIFIDSTGKAKDVMGRFYECRDMKTIYSEDVSELEAKAFLKRNLENTNVSPEKAFFELTGCRLGLLRKLVEMAHGKDELDRSKLPSYEEVRKKFLDCHGRPDLFASGILHSPGERETSEQKWKRNIISSLLRNERTIGRESLWSDGCVKAIQELQKNNVIQEVGWWKFAFYSPAVMTAAEELCWI